MKHSHPFFASQKFRLPGQVLEMAILRLSAALFGGARVLWVLALVVLASLSRATGAENVVLAWDPNSETDIVGYRIHYGMSSGNYTTSIDVGDTTTASISNLTPGNTYFFVVTAYNAAALESLPSNEASFTATIDPPPALISAMQRLPDGSFQLTLTNTVSAVGAQGINIYVSGDLTTWELLAHVENPTGTLVFTDTEAASADRRFYRLSAD